MNLTETTVNSPEFVQQGLLIEKAHTPAIEAHIVNKGDIFYKKGRILAENVYRQVWSTQNLIDENDYAVVVCMQGSVIGNINLQLRRGKKPLKSEVFFGQEHWQKYFHGSANSVAELSALAIAKELQWEFRLPTIMLLILGIQALCRSQGIKCLVTVQHKHLIHILTKRLNLPFFRNQNLETTQGSVPKDEYWKKEELPGVYYLTNNIQINDSCASFLCYLNLVGIQTSFLSRIKSSNLTYSAFRKVWNQEQHQSAF